jgi:quinoprotein glucose dehydrogenase
VRRWPLLLLAAGGCAQLAHLGLAPAPEDEPWPAYAHDVGGSKYSPANEVTRTNVGRLVPAWTYRTGDFALGRKQARDETTPLFVDGVLYASTPFGGVRALDGTSGKELWAFDPELDLDGDYGDFTNRGVSTWVDATGGTGSPCHRRIFVAPVDARLIALDARTGAPCTDFGRGGQVQLDEGLGNPPRYAGEYAITAPPLVVGDRVVVGSAVADNHRAAAPNGLVRAFDARTGALLWAWDPIPRVAADPGYDTWRGAHAHQTGAANAWAPLSADPERDLLFVPVGSASPDFFGGERLGQNLYANSVVALRASTGERVWHFQAVHHDIWDYDLASQPALFTLRRGGKEIPALFQPTKMGHLFVLDRTNGAPLFPVEERPVPASDVPGEEAWPTQPFPTLPAPLYAKRLTADDAFGLDDAGRGLCRERLARARSEGIFTPPSRQGSVLFPGNLGGANWSGAAIDPVRRLAVLPTNRVATLVQLIPRAEYEDPHASGDRLDDRGAQEGTAFAMQRDTLLGPGGVPCNPPPWGVLTAVDLDTGAVRWEVPLGKMGHLPNAPPDAGSINIGGVLATGGGLIFAGGALDQTFRAFDSETGKELWSAPMPAGVHAAPMTYTAEGKQFVVVAAGGHKDLRDKAGDYLVAFALDPAAAPPARPPTVGDYEGYLVLDTTRRHAQFSLVAKPVGLEVTLETPDGIGAAGDAQLKGSSFTADLAWTYRPKRCSGTFHFEGAAANDGTALIGEVRYVDGCEDGKEKRGTFSLWRGPRNLSRLPKH